MSVSYKAICAVVLGFILLGVQPLALAESKNLAPGFKALPKGSKLVVVQPDVELFSTSAGGVEEPKADWTDAAVQHLKKSIDGDMAKQNLSHRHLSDADADGLAEVNALHAAIARSIALHHMIAGNLTLPKKFARSTTPTSLPPINWLAATLSVYGAARRSSSQVATAAKCMV